jgi:serine/threonine protein kinase
MSSSLINFEKIYLHVPFEEKDWAKENGLKFDGKGKCWYLPPGKNPLKFRHYWAYLERTFDDRETLKRQGCRFNAHLKKWFVPPDKDFDDFRNWWPEPLKQFLFCDGRFAVHEWKSTGGQAEVFQAWDCEGDEGYVAVKFFFRDVGNRSTAMMRKSVGSEIEALQRLEDHPNIAKILDVDFKDEIERVAIVSRWIPGGDIESVLLDNDLEATAAALVAKFIDSGLVPLEDEEELIESILEALASDDTEEIESDLRLISGVLDGLIHAHSNGIIHRDITAKNVMFDFDFEISEPKVVICDFGISKKIKPEDFGNAKRSKFTSVEMRTEVYRPEFDYDTELGEKEIANQHTWDLYAWAVLTVETLAGKSLFSKKEVSEQLHGDVGNSLGEEITSLFELALSEDPLERPKDIKAFKVKLDAARSRRLKALE